MKLFVCALLFSSVAFANPMAHYLPTDQQMQADRALDLVRQAQSQARFSDLVKEFGRSIWSGFFAAPREQQRALMYENQEIRTVIFDLAEAIELEQRPAY